MRLLFAASLAAVTLVPAGDVEAAAGEPLADTGRGSSNLYVSPHGSDRWPGSKHRPFRTIARAQERVRSLTSRMRSDIVVHLRGGTYRLSRPLQFRAAAGDSGENGHRVVYQAHRYGTPAREHVVISGGREISNWHPVHGTDGLWRAHVGDLDTRQLYVNGRRAERASTGEGVPGGGGIPGNVTETETGYVTDSTEPQTWTNPDGIELVWLGTAEFNTWNEARCGVTGISGDAGSTTITMDQPCFRWAKKSYAGEFNGFPWIFSQPSRAENSVSFVDQAGEFSLDRSARGRHVLYYKPRPDENLRRTSVIAPELERLVLGKGRAGAPLHDIALRGLTFSHATWLAPDRRTGFVHHFGSIYEHGEPADNDDPFDLTDQARTMPGNVAFYESERIQVEGSLFTQLGAFALELGLGSSENVVQGNEFTDLSGGGVEVGNRYPGTNRDRVNQANLVANNWVHDIGVEYAGSTGIYVEMTQDATVSHNQVNDVPYTGIAFGEYWLLGAPTLTRGTRVAHNLVFDTLGTLNDGGGLWSVARQGSSFEDGAVVERNVTHDNIPPSTWSFVGGIGLFTDDDNDWITWRDNVTYRNGYAAFGGCVPLGHVRFLGNYWDNDQGGWGCGEPDEDVVLADNTLLSGGDARQACEGITECAAILREAGLEPAYRDRLLPAAGSSR